MSIEAGNNVSTSQVQKKSQLLSGHKFEQSDSLIIDYATLMRSNTDRFSDKLESRLQGIEDVNKCL